MSTDRIEKLLRANERFMALNREALWAEVRKLQEENDRLKNLVYYDSEEVTQKPVQFTETKREMCKGWYTDEQTQHSSHNYIPDTLAPAQYIEVLGRFRILADVVRWHESKAYRHCLDHDGVPYCSGKGLEEWAEYVAHGARVYQFSVKPVWVPEARTWVSSRTLARINEPYTDDYRKNVPASESLMRVWRDK